MGRRTRKHGMVDCSNSSSDQYFYRSFSIEPWMDACAVCDKESSYWSFRYSFTFFLFWGRHFYISTNFPLSYSIVLIRRSLKCTVEWFFQYSFNRADVNCVPLSDTMVSGRPWVANMLSSELIVAEVLVDADVLTSCSLGMRFRRNWLGYSIDGTCEIDMESAMVFFSFLAKELDFREMDLSWIIYAAICWII